MTKSAITVHGCAYYFAYGSNMAVERLASRIPAAEKFVNARLPGYCLRFHKVGADGSGKCDIVRSDSLNAAVYGVLFRVNDADLVTLDRIEGSGYERVSVVVLADAVGSVTTATYIARAIDPRLRPYRWYKEHVLRGAIANGLPAAWIAMLEVVACDDDPDRGQHAREMAIHR